jgi:hypothetical protein
MAPASPFNPSIILASPSSVKEQTPRAFEIAEAFLNTVLNTICASMGIPANGEGFDCGVRFGFSEDKLVVTRRLLYFLRWAMPFVLGSPFGEKAVTIAVAPF